MPSSTPGSGSSKKFFNRSLSLNSGGYDNPGFRRGVSVTSSVNDKEFNGDIVLDDECDKEQQETDIDEESFRSDLERDSAHSSLVNQVHNMRRPISEHEARYEQLVMQGKTAFSYYVQLQELIKSKSKQQICEILSVECKLLRARKKPQVPKSALWKTYISRSEKVKTKCLRPALKEGRNPRM